MGILYTFGVACLRERQKQIFHTHMFGGSAELVKMMGNGLLVLFGTPEPMPNHALLAIRSALRMADLLPELNELWPLRDQRPLRIGIHSGSLMDGLVGRGRRVEYMEV